MVMWGKEIMGMIIGRHGIKVRNGEGQLIVDFAKRMEMAVINTYFMKKDEQRITYKSGEHCTQVDYILYRWCNLKEIEDCKVFAGESVARQHRMVVCKMRKRERPKPKIKWWKLKENACKEDFRKQAVQKLGEDNINVLYSTVANVVREAAKTVLGVTSGRRKDDKETWWWNEEVQECIIQKKLAKKKWDKQKDEQSRVEYKEARRRAKKKVTKAKEKAYEELYEKSNSKEGEKDLYRLAKQRDKASKDVQQVGLIKDSDGNVLTSEDDILRR